MNTTSEKPARFCFARLRLAAFWIAWLIAFWILVGSNLYFALPVFTLAPLIRPDSYAERDAAFRRPSRWVPLALLVASIAARSLLPQPLREMVAAEGRTSVLIAATFLFYYFTLDLQLFRRLPPFRSS